MIDRKYILYTIILLVCLASFPLWINRFLLISLILILINISAAEVWSFMVKHAGIISLGQQMFIGLGGYVTAVLTEYYAMPPWLSLLVAGSCGCIFGGVISFPLLKLRGLYFAVGSLITAEIVKLCFSGWEFVGAGMGFVFRSAFDFPYYITFYLSLIIATCSVLLVFLLYRSKLGYGLRAIGCDEDAAASCGVNTFKCKAYCFIFAALIATFVGGIDAINRPYLHPQTNFSIGWTTSSLFVSVIGGMGTTIGPIIGSIIYIPLQFLLAQYAGLSLLLQGIIVLSILLIAPEGIYGIIIKKMRLKLTRL